MPSLVCKTHGTRKLSGALRLIARGALSSAMVTLALVIFFTSRAHSQQSPTLPAVNLGDTSFLDAVAFPGWLVEVIGQGVHDNKTLNNSGEVIPQITAVNSGALLLHIAWIGRQLAHSRRLVRAEIVLTGAYVDTGGHGVGQGLGDFTFAPIILQWPKHTVFGTPIYQRVTFDMDAPIGHYSPDSAVNIGNNAWDIHPYYAVTLFPAKRIEPAGASIISGMPPTTRLR